MYKASLFFLIFLVFSSCSNKGKELPDFQCADLSQVIWNNDSLRNKIVVVNVWATWCGTCIREIEALNRLQAKYSANTDVVFLAFSDENQLAVRELLLYYPFNYHHFVNASDFTGQIQTRIVKTYPQNLVVGRNGKILFDVSDGSTDIYKLLDETISAEIKSEI